MDIKKPLAYLGGMSAEQFLNEYWQKKPLLVRNAFPELAYRLSPEDLMELAQEDGVEARLILEKGKTPWELRKGPFTEKVFKQLPKTHWTLLVQAVDHYLPALADYLDYFSFIPQWRIDDIMISFAPEGGSVGPHYDQYDVFLIQGIGQRRWQLGQYCDESSPRVPNTPLRIIENMQANFDEVVNPGDLLYVPPHLSHYGVAQNDCTTYSIGFRAPALSHLLERVVDEALVNQGASLLFKDSNRVANAQSSTLSTQDLAQLQQQIMSLMNDQTLFKNAIAPFLSECKYDDYEPQGEKISLSDLRQALADGAVLRRDPASRFVITEGEQPELWINGECCDTPSTCFAFIIELCELRKISSENLAKMLSDSDFSSWLLTQIEIGFWFLDEE